MLKECRPLKHCLIFSVCLCKSTSIHKWSACLPPCVSANRQWPHGAILKCFLLFACLWGCSLAAAASRQSAFLHLQDWQRATTWWKLIRFKKLSEVILSLFLLFFHRPRPHDICVRPRLLFCNKWSDCISHANGAS